MGCYALCDGVGYFCTVSKSSQPFLFLKFMKTSHTSNLSQENNLHQVARYLQFM
ncbi:hypothetical protein SCG7086_AD_00040 [Chlamydiales bacterium SCGC AG-110-P3]|nr:hypothetical protein SCG7086_AD_00040 [Chlamydiales bacterium SCGC AG-110-P3]